MSKLLSTSRNTIRKIKAVTDSIRLSWEDASKMTNEEFVHTIFPKTKMTMKNYSQDQIVK